MSEFDTETMAFPAVELPGEFDASTLPAATVPRPARPLPWRRWLSQPRWLSLATVLGLCAGWWWVTALQLVPPLFLPSPQAVLGKLYQVATEGYMDATLWQHLSASLARVAVALLAAALTAIPLGILLAVIFSALFLIVGIDTLESGLHGLERIVLHFLGLSRRGDLIDHILP